MKALALVFLLFATPAIQIDTTKLAARPSFYVCPKDAAMLRVVNAPRNATYHCPVDGTEMKESIGRGKQYWLLN